jgi:rhodanese-related sulfurtransferase
MKRNAASLRLWFFCAAFCAFFVLSAHGQFQPAESAAGAFSIPLNALMQPQALNDLLQKPAHEPALILQVGSHLLFAQAHIPGSEYAGPGSQTAGLEALRARVAAVAKDKLIVLYCGCCPWNRCPNVAPAFRMLRDAGFTNVRVLYMASNFGDDWVAKGYRVEKGR